MSWQRPPLPTEVTRLTVAMLGQSDKTVLRRWIQRWSVGGLCRTVTVDGRERSEVYTEYVGDNYAFDFYILAEPPKDDDAKALLKTAEVVLFVYDNDLSWCQRRALHNVWLPQVKQHADLQPFFYLVEVNDKTAPGNPSENDAYRLFNSLPGEQKRFVQSRVGEQRKSAALMKNIFLEAVKISEKRKKK